MKKTGAEILWECLVREGVEVVFGYPGGANMPIYDAMLSYPIHHVLVRQRARRYEVASLGRRSRRMWRPG